MKVGKTYDNLSQLTRFAPLVKFPIFDADNTTVDMVTPGSLARTLSIGLQRTGKDRCITGRLRALLKLSLLRVPLAIRIA
jgi:hypothetical protein